PSRYAPRYVASDLSCSSCHLNAGQREGAIPLVGVAGRFPMYNGRCARLFSLRDRVVAGFLRSMNGSNAQGATESNAHENAAGEPFISTRSPEVMALSAYVTWLSEGLPVGQPPARGGTQLPPAARIPV